MKVGDLVVQGESTRPGVLVEIIESNVFGGDLIVTVLWHAAPRPLKTMASSLRKLNA